MPCTFPGLDPNPATWFKYVECVAVDTVVSFVRSVVNSIAAGFVQFAHMIEQGLLYLVGIFVMSIAWVGNVLIAFFQAVLQGTGVFAPLLVGVGVLGAVLVAYLIVVLGKFLGERLIERF